ncbi:MAG: ComF family protein [bacterium]|jgi:ComF family protein
MRESAREMVESIIHLFYPSICFGCDNEIIAEDELLCLSCIQSLPYTSFERIPDNPVAKLFWGRCKVTTAFSVFYFIEKTPLQKIIHQIKYKNEKELGVYMGRLMGNKIKELENNIQFDMCIPMPLHPKKEKIRGYNQSTLLAKGIQDVTGIPTALNTLNRMVYTTTQTKKSRTDRWINVENAFHVYKPEIIKDKHILLVDDVITTGASIESCVHTLLSNGAAGVAVAGLAFTL